MKQKYIFLGMFISIIILISFSLIFMNVRKNRIINIKTIDSYSKKITILKNDIQELDEGDCQNNLNIMLDKINTTYFSENLTIKEYYEAYYQEPTFLSIYDDIKVSCEIANEVADEIYIDVLTSIVYPESIKLEYMHIYELKFLDDYSRKNYNKQYDETGTYINKTLELNILKSLIEEVKS